MFTIILPGLLLFCRVVIVLVFAFSSVSKARNFTHFKQTIARFALLPTSLHSLAALSFICSEFAVVILVAVGGVLLGPAFVLALLLLLLFCGALLSVLVRRIETSCNCFGSNEKQVSPVDILRNAGLILCALGGCSAFYWKSNVQEALNLAELALISLGACVFVAIWLQLSEIVSLFRQN